jgi:hypothetical protein
MRHRQDNTPAARRYNRAMKFRDVMKSPVFRAGHRWTLAKRPGVYESEVTALIRTMRQDERIRQDQRFAWERWRREALPRQTIAPDDSSSA